MTLFQQLTVPPHKQRSRCTQHIAAMDNTRGNVYSTVDELDISYMALTVGKPFGELLQVDGMVCKSR